MTDGSRVCTDRGGLLGGAYNARCQLCFLPAGDPPPSGSNLQALAEHGQSYLTLDW